MSKRYKATRSVHYVDTKGQDRLAAEGDWVTDLSPTQEAEMLADETIRESRAKD